MRRDEMKPRDGLDLQNFEIKLIYKSLKEYEKIYNKDNNFKKHVNFSKLYEKLEKNIKTRKSAVRILEDLGVW